MKYIFPLLVLLVSMNCSKAQIENLQDFQWKNRLLIIYAGDKQASTLENQLDAIRVAEEGYEERDLLVIILKDQTVTIWNSSASHHLKFDDITDQLSIATDKSYVNLLIGKDGRVKLRDETLIANKKLFNTIDAMPMRQREMHDGN